MNHFYWSHTQILEPPVANAGSDKTVCGWGGSTYLGDATATYDSVLWTTSGSGTFESPTSLNTYFMWSHLTGTETLTLTATKNGSSVQDSLIITYDPIPTVFAGNDVTLPTGINYYNTVTAGHTNDATATNYSSLQWSVRQTSPTTSVTFTNPTNINTQISVPSNFTGWISVDLTAYGNNTCLGVVTFYDTIYLYFTAATNVSVNAGTDKQSAGTIKVPLSDASSQNATSISWSTSGYGTFDNSNVLNTQYAPHFNDLNAGSVILTLTGYGLNGPVTDTCTITLVADVRACTTVISAGGYNFPSRKVVNLGTGTGEVVLEYFFQPIPDKIVITYNGSTVLNTGYRGNITYQSDLNNTLNGLGLPSEPIVGFQNGVDWFTKSSSYPDTAIVDVYGPLSGTAWDFVLRCPGTTAMWITAGVHLSVTGTTPVYISQAKKLNVPTVLWTHNGFGTFNNPNIINPTYTPAVADFGRVVYLTVTGSGNGSPVSNSINLTVFDTPIELPPTYCGCIGTNLVANGGTSSTTDWVSSNGWLGDGWYMQEDISPSIITGNGFIGNAQRVNHPDYIGSIWVATPDIAQTDASNCHYNISFRYRCLGSETPLSIYQATSMAPLINGDIYPSGLINITTINNNNTGAATCFSVVYFPTNNSFRSLVFMSDDVDGVGFFEIDEVCIIRVQDSWPPPDENPS